MNKNKELGEEERQVLSYKIIDEVFERYGVEDEQLQKALVVYKDELLLLESETPLDGNGLLYKK